MIPDLIKSNIEIIKVSYLDYNNIQQDGIIECNNNISNDLKLIFNELLILRFQIYSIIPISYYDNDDYKSVLANNTSCFNYRNIIGSNKLSLHSTGNAIDINPFQNPWIHPNAHKIEGRMYIPNTKGTISKDVVSIFEKYGFSWGGYWENPDYQHFYKL